MTLISRMTVLSARLSSLHSRFGDPRYPAVYLVGSPDTQIVPNPLVQPVSANHIGKWLSESVQVLGDELVVSFIPRTYLETTVSRSRYRIGTEVYEVVRVDQEQLTWTVTLRPFRGR